MGEVAFKLTKTVGDGGHVSEVVGGEDLPLHDGKVDLDLIEPARMARRVNELPPRIPGASSLHGPRAAVRGAVIDDPGRAVLADTARWT